MTQVVPVVHRVPLGTDVPIKPRLSSVEAIRACAAAIVVLYHVARHLDNASGTPLLRLTTQFGHAGVDLFFVVSGFIILFVHYRDVGRPGRLRHYLARRVSRVMPTYWIALSLTVLLSIAAGHAMPALSRLLWSVALLPSAEEPILGVAWTLQYEIVFYAVFCLLILRRSVGLLLLMIWLGWILGGWAGFITSHAVIPGSLYGTFNLEFFLGMGVAYWLRRGTVIMPRAILAVGLALFVAVALAENAGIIDGYAAPARLAYGIPSALLILGAVEAERSGRLNVPGWMSALGGASYSIYLFQFIFIGIAWKLLLAVGLDDPAATWAAYPLLVCAAMTGGVMMTQMVERPLMSIMRGERPFSGAGLFRTKKAV
jgi:exopolysaccharide production protein ExoZ